MSEVIRLSRASATVGEIAEPFDISVQAISKHIQVLEHAGLVTRTRQAQRSQVHLDLAVLETFEFDPGAQELTPRRPGAGHRVEAMTAQVVSVTVGATCGPTTSPKGTLVHVTDLITPAARPE